MYYVKHKQLKPRKSPLFADFLFLRAGTLPLRVFSVYNIGVKRVMPFSVPGGRFRFLRHAAEKKEEKRFDFFCG